MSNGHLLPACTSQTIFYHLSRFIVPPFIYVFVIHCHFLFPIVSANCQKRQQLFLMSCVHRSEILSGNTHRKKTRVRSAADWGILSSKILWSLSMNEVLYFPHPWIYCGSEIFYNELCAFMSELQYWSHPDSFSSNSHLYHRWSLLCS